MILRSGHEPILTPLMQTVRVHNGPSLRRRILGFCHSGWYAVLRPPPSTPVVRSAETPPSPPQWYAVLRPPTTPDPESRCLTSDLLSLSTQRLTSDLHSLSTQRLTSDLHSLSTQRLTSDLHSLSTQRLTSDLHSLSTQRLTSDLRSPLRG
ncbi:unnamed protein product [Gadus morhua 'NCC']